MRFFILDEADGLLQQGYGDMVNKIHSNIPKLTADGKRLQVGFVQSVFDVVFEQTIH